MAQKREKEETELKVTEPLIRTSPIPTTTTPNLSVTVTDDSASNSDLPVDRLSSHQSDGSDSDNRSAQRSDPPLHNTNLARSRSERFLQPASESDRLFSSEAAAAAAMAEMKRREVNRCAGCRRKVGLTGFRCRCGEMFCPEHRYSDRHDCSFDYKAAGREMIARENPVVRAAKILKV